MIISMYIHKIIYIMKTKYLLLITFITSNLSAQNGFTNFECLNTNPEAYAIYTAGGVF